MSIKEALTGAEIVNGKDDGKGGIEYLILVKGDKVIVLKSSRRDAVITCEEMK